MSIHALPQTAVRALGSGQALTDPASVVKELVDNALDARATNITIEISTNTLDVIQVKDNGHGIAPSDRSLVAKPYCTSKLKDEKDLALVGSSYLGFRGEALNSALEMSGEMTITTRVEGESVAAALRISSTGEMVEERASHPAGTTVRIVRFLKSQPVRKQVALKNASKTLGKLKKLFHAYAFARPDTRLSFRVLKAKDDRDNWTYAPKAGSSGIEDTVLKLVGKPCASQCARVELDSGGFVLEAFLPRSDAHATKISNLGQYVSVNRRPLTTTRGISKQLIRIFKERVKDCPALEDAKDPFMYLSVSCPPESYDANIEPAKDDVLFADVDKISAAMRGLMDIAYPEKAAPSEEEPGSMVHLQPSDKRAMSGHEEALNSPGPQSKRQHTEVLGNMYEVDEDDLTQLMDAVDDSVQPVAEGPEEEPESTKSAAVSNPWIMAKMNSYGNKKNNISIQLMTPAKEATSSLGVARSQEFEPQPTPHLASGLLTPQTSSPIKRHSPSEDPGLSDNLRTIGPSDLPPPVPYLIDQSISPMGRSIEAVRDSPARRLTLPQSEAEGTTLDMIPEAVSKRRTAPKQAQRGFVNKPFVPPIDPERDAWFHFPETQRRNPPFARKGRSQMQCEEGFVPPGEPFEIPQPQRLTPPANNADIREFLGRGRPQVPASALSVVDTTPTLDGNVAPTTRPKNGFVRASELNLDSTPIIEPSRSPRRRCRRRKTGDDGVPEVMTGNGIAVNDEDGDDDDDDDDGDEFHVDTTRQKRRRTADTTTTTTTKTPRTKSSTLPLEKVPLSAYMQNVVTSLSATATGIEEHIRNAEPEGTFTAWNEPASGTASAVRQLVEADVRAWTASLRGLLQAYGRHGEVVRDLEDVVRSAVDRWAAVSGA